MSFKGKITLIEERIASLYQRLKKCDICPRNCQVDRLKGEKGYCGGGKDLLIYTAFLHQGEEPGISGGKGSGTIFLSGCNLKCLYCQNYRFSHLKQGKTIEEKDLAKIMLNLQKKGAVNINLVTPTHFLPQILRSLLIAYKKGLKLPLVYNTSGYEKKEVISQLEGIVDVYLTDFRYLSPALAKKYSQAWDYPQVCQESLVEMCRQIPKTLWKKDILQKGVIIRQLVLPGHIQESKQILSWIKENIPLAYVSVMSQYRPYFKAFEHPPLNRPLNQTEYSQIKAFIEELGLEGWVQDFQPEYSLAGAYFRAGINDYL